jgi:hypothetical protein
MHSFDVTVGVVIEFVYFGMKVVDPYSEVGQAVFNYQVLTITTA